MTAYVPQRRTRIFVAKPLLDSDQWNARFVSFGCSRHAKRVNAHCFVDTDLTTILLDRLLNGANG